MSRFVVSSGPRYRNKATRNSYRAALRLAVAQVRGGHPDWPVKVTQGKNLVAVCFLQQRAVKGRPKPSVSCETFKPQRSKRRR